jgi:DNA-binding LacI/PurR family transcriptional regulator
MKKISITDIARQAGVSKMTVSRVINNAASVKDDTRDRILGIIEKEGYQPNVLARTFSSGVSLDVVGVITGIENVFSKYYFMELMRQLENHLDQYDHSVFLFNVIETENKERIEKKLKIICDQYHARAMKGVIILGPPEKDARMEFLSEQGVTGMVIGSTSSDKNFGSVDIDNKAGMRLMIKYLFDEGHRHFGAIHGPEYMSSAIERREAFYETLTELGLKVPKEYEGFGGYNRRGGYLAALDIVRRTKRPSVIVCANDDSALGAYDACLEKGLNIPNDISIVGFDNSDIACGAKPQLTTIGQPFHQIAEIVSQAFSTNEFIMHKKVEPILIERSSVARI